MPDEPIEQSGLDSLLGFRLGLITADHAEVSVEISDRHRQPYGIVHGGTYCTLVETVASLGAQAWLGERGTVVGVANHTDFLRQVGSGVVTATATPIQRGRTQQLWQVHIRDTADRLLAQGQLRLANLPSQAVPPTSATTRTAAPSSATATPATGTAPAAE